MNENKNTEPLIQVPEQHLEKVLADRVRYKKGCELVVKFVNPFMPLIFGMIDLSKRSNGTISKMQFIGFVTQNFGTIIKSFQNVQYSDQDLTDIVDIAQEFTTIENNNNGRSN